MELFNKTKESLKLRGREGTDGRMVSIEGRVQKEKLGAWECMHRWRAIADKGRGGGGAHPQRLCEIPTSSKNMERALEESNKRRRQRRPLCDI